MDSQNGEVIPIANNPNRGYTGYITKHKNVGEEVSKGILLSGVCTIAMGAIRGDAGNLFKKENIGTTAIEAGTLAVIFGLFSATKALYQNAETDKFIKQYAQKDDISQITFRFSLR